MAATPSFLSSSGLLILLIYLSSSATARAAVPTSQRFRFVNFGPVADYFSEYFTDYRPLDVFFFPFRLAFYNSTPDVYYLGIKMGSHRTESTFRWVWDANRSHPVRENATLSFGADGNLVLADSDGTVAWQTGTANKGVVGLRMLPTGNMVLYDSRGRFVWQSFDHPTDTLLVGQSLRAGGPARLTSRTSDRDGSDGPYSLVLEPKGFAMYVTPSSGSKPVIYFNSNPKMARPEEDGTLNSLAFKSKRNDFVRRNTDITLEFDIKNPLGPSPRTYTLALAKYNATLSFLRVDLDGNLRVYTFVAEADTESWETPFLLFRKDGLVDECGWPSRCGTLGMCEDSQCVACPVAKGLIGWSRDCAPPAVTACKVPAKAVDYYKVVGAEHFSDGYDEGQGPMKVAECRDLCGKDCRCLGFFYKVESSRCLLAPLIGTITKVANASHVAYIKTFKK